MAGTTRPQRTARQQQLLDRLVDLCEAEGFAAFTLDELTVRLGCSKTTLYSLAGSKQELAVEVVRESFRRAVDIVETRLAGVEGAAARIETYLRAVADRLQSLSEVFLADIARLPATDAVYRRNTQAAAERIRGLIAEGVASGELRQVHAAFVGEMVAATMFEIQRGRMFERLELADAEAYAELATFVVQALTD
ncbi:TetR/AcrR family transcriptional regulator [Nocardioides sp. ChNu-153]|uniref:TetR/AcrR family transcriptional regulator n=1 Tax=unclassified Nocardioides TaxID=2615069 RepID=UPI002404A538|nr:MULTISPECIES: TetR/AcrR family transcriptional regulator [unclassified Nocardioides]MDF9714954.1 TetR/AcrR family transcriptional regulator [Nocardioides sp. ChNu-99]MDN7122449.1 TetR/AcrR family transcriptional regulator [Nocardioides sp. ChNu-153]